MSDWSVLGKIRVGSSVTDLAFSPDGKTLASAAEGVNLWSVANGEKIAALTGHIGWVEEAAFSPDGTTVVSGGRDDGRLRAQNIKTYLESGRQGDIVRLIYFLPSDRTAQSDINSKIETWVKGVQKFYADMMEERGYGRKTFTYETDENGNAAGPII